jgi:hypothetical protein
MKGYILIIFILIFLFNCKENKKEINNTNLLVVNNNSKESKIMNFFDNPFIMEIKFVENDIKKNFGDPIKIEIKKQVKSFLGPQKISGLLKELYYKNFIIKVFLWNNKEYLLNILIIDNELKLKYNIKTGDSKEDIVNILGDPREVNIVDPYEKENENILTYYLFQPKKIKFYFNNNKLIKIELIYLELIN